ncbi:hypothetical protein EST38_g10320 [Candolleomyces aberdarensis]|uniref:F-box domain-containing protein n=1 Tax=Candolleomyces aberdarensis TaxID=2316362 RepID=A0A4Q2DAK1_9AGAR|nr:hypothetical protein EST38_g10320 [Candolleomyces aberdarensis]
MPTPSQPSRPESDGCISLFVFPRELIDSIVEDTRGLGDNDSTLRSLAITCKDILDICRPLLFEKVTITSGRDYTALLSALRNDSSVISMVHNVRVEFLQQDFDSTFQHTSRARVFRQLSEVRKLSLGSPLGSRCRSNPEDVNCSLQPIKSLVPMLSSKALVSLSIVFFSLPSSIFSLCTNLKELNIQMGCIVECPVESSPSGEVERPQLEALSINHTAQSRWPVPGGSRYTAADDKLAFPDLKNLQHLKAWFPDYVLRSIIDEPEGLKSLHLQVRAHNVDQLETFLSKELFRSNPNKRRSLKNLTVEVLCLERGFDIEKGLDLEQVLPKFIRPLACLKNVERFEFIGVFESPLMIEGFKNAMCPVSRDFAHTFLESVGACNMGTMLTELNIKIACKEDVSAPGSPNGREFANIMQQASNILSRVGEQAVADIFAAAGIRLSIQYDSMLEELTAA